MENAKRVVGLIAILLVVMLSACSNGQAASATTTPAATTSPFASFDLQPVPVAGSYQFTEGPATDAKGNVYFTDPFAGKIYKWTPDGSVTLFLEGVDLPIGMEFDKGGNLIACEGGAGRVISIDPQGNITVLADQYNDVRFNEPNDLWIDAQGGIYFTDPHYEHGLSQDGEFVYYLSPDHSQVTRVISDKLNPNGIVGTTDGTTLYVADYNGNKIFAYTIHPDGTLSDKRSFGYFATLSDGMTLDAAGNLYVASQKIVQIYNAAGARLKIIIMPERATNVTFAGVDGMTLFITAETKVYTLDMSSVFGK